MNQQAVSAHQTITMPSKNGKAHGARRKEPEEQLSAWKIIVAATVMVLALFVGIVIVVVANSSDHPRPDVIIANNAMMKKMNLAIPNSPSSPRFTVTFQYQTYDTLSPSLWIKVDGQPESSQEKFALLIKRPGENSFEHVQDFTKSDMIANNSCKLGVSISAIGKHTVAIKSHKTNEHLVQEEIFIEKLYNSVQATQN